MWKYKITFILKSEYGYSKCKHSRHQTKKPNSLIKLKPSKKASFKCQPSVITGLCEFQSWNLKWNNQLNDTEVNLNWFWIICCTTLISFKWVPLIFSAIFTTYSLIRKLNVLFRTGCNFITFNVSIWQNRSAQDSFKAFELMKSVTEVNSI